MSTFSRFKDQVFAPAADWLSHQTKLVRIVAAAVLGFLITWVVWEVIGLAVGIALLSFVTHGTPIVDFRTFRTVAEILLVIKILEVVVFVAVSSWVYKLLNPGRSSARGHGDTVAEPSSPSAS